MLVLRVQHHVDDDVSYVRTPTIAVLNSLGFFPSLVITKYILLAIKNLLPSLRCRIAGVFLAYENQTVDLIYTYSA